MTERLHLATATGLVFVVLAFHFATGLVALVAGSLAIAARKGGTWHRKSGVVFVYAMIALGLTAAGISVYEGKSVTGGAFAAYLVFTAFTTVKPLPGVGRRADLALLVVPLSAAAVTYASAITALGLPGKEIDGAPAGMLFFVATIALLACVGDIRMMRAGGLQGTRRLARHLWRMCFGLFVASGSFFLGQSKFIPRPVRIMPLILALAVAPLVLLLYWMWRVRLRQNLRGLLTTIPILAKPPA